MATAKKTSPDYDPIEEAFDIGAGLGRQEERRVRKPHVERARRGGARRGAAEAKRQAEQDRKRRAEKTRKANARMRASRESKGEAESLARKQREAESRANRERRREEELASARRGAYRGGQAAAKQAMQDAQRQSRATSSSSRGANSGAALSAPNVNLAPSGAMSGGLDKTTSARVIIVAVALGAIGVVARSAMQKAPTKSTVKLSGGATIAVPDHLRSLAGVFVMGTIALIVNEFSAGLGLAMGIGIGLDVGLASMSGTSGLFNKLGSGLLNGQQEIGPKPPGATNTGAPTYTSSGATTTQPTTASGPQGLAVPTK